MHASVRQAVSVNINPTTVTPPREATTPATMRMMTAERPEGVILPDDMANYPGHSGKFMLKLLGAWMAMGFRRPAIDGVP